VIGAEWRPTAEGSKVKAVAGAGVIEVAVPLELLGEVEPGDEVQILAVISAGDSPPQDLPADGPALLQLPDLGQAEPVLHVEDPQGDDSGPGTYAYPTDPVFEPQVFDLRSFSVAMEPRSLVFTFELFGPLTNPWGSPNGLALQALDVYVDTDPGRSTGPRLLLPGRNAALAEGFGWEAAIWAEGWTPQFLRPDEGGLAVQDGQVNFKIVADPAGRRVSLRVPRAAFGEGDPTQWAYAAVVLSQDGFPSPGVWRVRDVEPEAKQWRLGGGPGASNQPRILNVAWPLQAEITPQDMLSSFRPSAAPPDTLTAEAFAQLPMLRP
jgi:carbohydrate-binding DOMON domain-containing protein